MSEPTTENRASWIETVSCRLERRNELECKPYVPIYQSVHELWKKNVYLDSVRVSTKHNIAIIEHETSDYLSKGDYGAAVSNMSKKIAQLHADLKPFNAKIDTATVGVDLSKRIYDQKKLILNQEEEIRMAKHEIIESFQKLASLEESFNAEKAKTTELEEQIAQLQATLTKKEGTIDVLSAENHDLTSRILTEKNKSAELLDNMISQSSRGRNP
jgi:chromosome segregation ATPase